MHGHGIRNGKGFFMNDRERLQKLLDTYLQQLLQHPVLQTYTQSISIILKGSFARGFADKYTDIDLVIYADDTVYGKIITGYAERGLTPRQDGVFLPLGNWDGHYNLDSYARLLRHCADDPSALWEYANARILHDPAGKARAAIEHCKNSFGQNIGERLKQQYLQLQLQLDWLRQPLRRADAPAVLLYAAAFWRESCRLLFLLRGKPYPCDKWLFYYAKELDLPDALKDKILNYGQYFGDAYGQQADLELEQYPLYAKGSEIAAALAEMLHARCPEARWIDEWYLYA